ncbi:MAG: glycosyltransferase family 4 protein, partial [Kiritimatiellaeota bacterium]|nr:glycosyltransferase family 4 protein [Kiritimatiellota bacterium]
QLHVVQLHTSRGWGGGEQQVLLLLSRLQARGVRATLCAHPDGQLWMRARSAGLDTLPLPRLARWGWPGAWRLLAPLLAPLSVDLFHAQDSRSLSLGLGLARAEQRPLVLSRRIASPVRGNFCSRRKYAARRISAVIAISETVRQVFTQSSGFPPERIYLAPDGLDGAALERVLPDTELRRTWQAAGLVGGLGKLSPGKNWGFLVRVAARLARPAPDLHWLIAGEGGERRRLERLIRELGVGGRVHLLGFRADALAVLKSCDVLFFPSRREGAAVPVREAMALGVPVVATDTPGVRESLGGHGWLVRPGDVAGAAEAVLAALRDDAVRAAQIAGAREFAQRFSADAMADATVRVYREVLAGAAR